MAREPKFEVLCEEHKGTIALRMQGMFDEATMQGFAAEYKRATDTFRGGAHIVFADMRDMGTASPDVAAVLGEAIGYARKRGVICCVHLSNSTIQKLQAARIAREMSEGDDVTIDCGSLEEANQVLDEAQERLRRAKATGKPWEEACAGLARAVAR